MGMLRPSRWGAEAIALSDMQERAARRRTEPWQCMLIGVGEQREADAYVARA